MAADAGIPILETEIEQRIAYTEALTMGKTIFECSAGRGSAVTEIQALTHELADRVMNDEVEKLHQAPHGGA